MVNGQMDFPVLSICTDAPGPGQAATRLWIGSADGDVFEMDLRRQSRSGHRSPAPGDATARSSAPERYFKCRLSPPRLAVSISMLAQTTGCTGTLQAATGRPRSRGSPPAPRPLTTSSALCLAQVGAAWLVGTGQRGLWRLDNNAWTRLSNGLSRAGHLTDQRDSSCNCFKATVPPGRAGTHVVYVPSAGPHGLTCTLALTAGGPLAGIDLFHASPAINPAQNQWAGALRCNVSRPNPLEVHLTDPVAPGYYLVVVRTGATLTSYELAVDITP